MMPCSAISAIDTADRIPNYQLQVPEHSDIAMTTATLDVTLSDRAAKRIARILSKEAEGTALRISVSGGGCSGFQYAFDLDATRAPDDLVIEKAGATVLIDQISLPYMDGSEIDFADDLIGQSFQIKNPLATASCGCGTSFAL
jgi:iron-sulfur cluster assembly accessory protein